MATRGNVIYNSIDREQMIYYSHCDAYPSGLGADVKNVLDISVKSKRCFLDVFKQELYYAEWCERVHGDIDYLYVVTENESDYVFKAYKFDMFDKRKDYIEYLLNETEPLECVVYDKNYVFDTISQDRYNEILSENEHIIERIGKEANEVHTNVNQTYSSRKLPYFVHLEAVAVAAKRYAHYITTNEDDVLPVIFGAYFHDSIEDARLTYNDLLKIAKNIGLSDEQAKLGTEIVYALTNEKGKTRAERANERYYSYIRWTKYAPLVKLCDRYANIFFGAMNKEEDENSMRMYKVYKKEMEHFIKSIKNKSAVECEYMLPQQLVDDILKI